MSYKRSPPHARGIRSPWRPALPWPIRWPARWSACPTASRSTAPAVLRATGSELAKKGMPPHWPDRTLAFVEGGSWPAAGTDGRRIRGRLIVPGVASPVLSRPVPLTGSIGVSGLVRDFFAGVRAGAGSSTAGFFLASADLRGAPQGRPRRMLLDIDRERVTAAKWQKESENARRAAAEAADRHQAQVGDLQQRWDSCSKGWARPRPPWSRRMVPEIELQRVDLRAMLVCLLGARAPSLVDLLLIRQTLGAASPWSCGLAAKPQAHLTLKVRAPRWAGCSPQV